AMGRLAADDPYLEMEGSVDYHVATGISRPDFFNWPYELQTQIQARRPNLVIFMVGSNDDQALRAPNGTTYPKFSPGWDAEYSRRAGAVMDQVIKDGAVIVWIGSPIINNPGRSQGYQHMNALVKA